MYHTSWYEWGNLQSVFSNQPYLSSILWTRPFPHLTPPDQFLTKQSSLTFITLFIISRWSLIFQNRFVFHVYFYYRLVNTFVFAFCNRPGVATRQSNSPASATNPFILHSVLSASYLRYDKDVTDTVIGPFRGVIYSSVYLIRYEHLL